jgi:hypothetical protein
VILDENFDKFLLYEDLAQDIDLPIEINKEFGNPRYSSLII